MVPFTLFFLSTLCQRFGFWLSGYPFPLVLIIAPLTIGRALLRGQMKASVIRSLLFLTTAAAFATSFALGRSEWTSLQSILLFFALYIPWIFFSPTTPSEYGRYVMRVAFWVSLFSIIAAVQYFGQFIYPSELWFSWKSILPAGFLIEYNTLNETHYDSGIYKGNGFFFLEPSTLSGLIARVFLLVLLVLGDVRYVVPFVLGLIFALSGTGILFVLLFASVPLIVLLSRRASSAPILALSIFVAVSLAIIVSSFYFADYFIGRTSEFTDPRASGYARFTSTIIIFEKHLTTDLLSFLFGYGPGSFQHIASEMTDETFGSGWIKLFIEYGFFGILSFSAFFLYCVYTSTRSLYIALALLFQYLVLDGALLVPQLSFLSYAIFVMPVRSGDKRCAEHTLQA